LFDHLGNIGSPSGGGYDFNAWLAEASTTSATLKTIKADPVSNQSGTVKAANKAIYDSAMSAASATYQNASETASTNYALSSFTATTIFLTTATTLGATYNNAINTAYDAYMIAESNAWNKYVKQATRLDQAYSSAIAQLTANPNFDAAGYVQQVVTSQSSGGTGGDVQPLAGGGGNEGESDILRQLRNQRQIGDELAQKAAGVNMYPYQGDAVQGVNLFAHLFPVSAQYMDIQTLIDKNKPEIERIEAVASLILDFTALLGAAGKATEIGEGIRTIEKSAMKKVGKAADVVETSAQQVAKTVRVASEAAAASADKGKIVRYIQKGEKLGDVINEIKGLTHDNFVEHAVVKLETGARAVISGGPSSISMKGVKTIYAHVHPYHLPARGPSPEDYQALQKLEQGFSYIFEHGRTFLIDLMDIEKNTPPIESTIIH